jgi:branched-subunit amino acid transport protein
MQHSTMILIAGMALVTYLTRFSFLYLFRNITLPPYLYKGFQFLPIGILTAMIVPGLTLSQGHIFIHWQNYYLLAGIASTLAALRWKSMFASLGVGLAVILILNFIM